MPNAIYETMIQKRTFSFRYLGEQFRQNWNDPAWYYFQFTNQVVPRYYSLCTRNDGFDVLDENWDTLIILDGCRYDLFEAVLADRDWSGRLERKRSKGSATRQFLFENFEGRDLSDIVYVTAKRDVDVILGDQCERIVNVWEDDWDEENETVFPEAVVDSALDQREQYPDDRLIVHFVQPHCPFVSEVEKEGNFWQVALREGVDEVKKAYRSNLEFVLPHVRTLVDDLSGKTVVTADHGNAMGEPAAPFRIPIYGHPEGVRIPFLVDVPWFEPTPDTACADTDSTASKGEGNA